MKYIRPLVTNLDGLAHIKSIDASKVFRRRINWGLRSKDDTLIGVAGFTELA
jgi:hypothetical protein